MKIMLSAACAAFALAAAGVALADGQVNVTLAQPTSTAKLVAGHAVFRCEGAACVAGYAPDASGSLDACKDLAKKVGHITYYAQTKPLSDKALAECNAVAAAPHANATASR
ncbi:MAG: hypothetical protein KGL69_03420 [Alphaproteobacteria bacterium]|jgi:hypothetical protein|nr:hypothetical protein [Alphaproteobacteria bacterium]